jgi:hypothetical protein
MKPEETTEVSTQVVYSLEKKILEEGWRGCPGGNNDDASGSKNEEECESNTSPSERKDSSGG